MQFVTGGPNVPEHLVQAHEKDRVVFFCGAGISYPAGLPGFGGLVDALYAHVGESPDVLEQELVTRREFDRVIGQLESRVRGGRQSVRRHLGHILAPDLARPRSLTTHLALLTLGRSSPNGGLRIVTTNFDTLFEAAARRFQLPAPTIHPDAPVRPQWQGVVHLHGRLPENPSDADLERLILSDGDFGQAYLTHGWAARFVAGLFREFTLCFVGYSIDDPVLRYMAAAHALGAGTPEVFAFAGHRLDQTDDADRLWRAKHVTPILYDDAQDHRALHRTLHRWGSIYRDGVAGKERIVTRYAHRTPKDSCARNNFISRVLWALSDPSGLPAQRFVTIAWAPSFEWLDILTERRFAHDDLGRFGVPPLQPHEEKQLLAQYGSRKLEFSLLDRPASYLRAPYMAVVHRGSRETSPDELMSQLTLWLLRYLDEPRLIHWLAKRGGALSDFLARVLEQRLDEIQKWERDGDTVKLDELRRRSPQAIPRSVLRPLWRLMLTGHVRTRGSSFGLYQWFDRFRRDGLTASLRLALRELLAPRIALREPFISGELETEDTAPERLKALVEWELVLACDHVHSALRDRTGSGWQAALPALLDDATALLRDALDLMAELGEANAQSDLSYLQQPSIGEHPQNRDFHDWTALIDLTRDAWLATAANDPERARLVAAQWWRVNYPIFRRLSFFAAAHGDIIPTEQALTWLLTDDGWWLWSVETERETLRLLVALAPRLEGTLIAPLEAAIIAGPPRRMFTDDLEDEHWTRVFERKVWLRLAKLHAAGAHLDEASRTRRDELSARYPEWQLATDERDEFALWMESGTWGEAAEPTPHRRRQLMQWLHEHPDEDHWKGDDWAERCRKHFATTACALWALAQKGFWPTSRWLRALQAWSEEGLQKRSWRYMAPLLATAPNNVIAALAHGVSWWLQKVAKVFDRHEDAFFALCERVLDLDDPDGVENNDPVTRAINHPVGHVTQALLDWWYRRQLQNDQGLPPEIEPLFTQLCDVDQQHFRHGRVLLSAHAVNLFLVDRNWTTQNLLPLFDWQRSGPEARAAWHGFLWSPRLVRPYLAAIKPNLLETARHYAELGDHGSQYAASLTHAALDRGDTFAIEELRDAFRSLPPEGLAEAVDALARAMEGAGEQRESYWTTHVAPFWKDIWPKSANTSPEIADDLFRLCVAAGPNFPAALDATRAWLVTVPHPDYLVHLLNSSGLCKQLPETALGWLSLLIDAQPWAPSELRDCLRTISQASSGLLQDGRYQRLDEYSRRHGM